MKRAFVFAALTIAKEGFIQAEWVHHARRAYAVYRPHHIERGIGMVLKAVGLKANGQASRWVTRAAWWIIRTRIALLTRAAA